MSHRWLIVPLLTLFLGLSAPAWAGIISESQEIDIGRQAAVEIESQYRLYPEIGMTERLNRVAGQLLTRKKRNLPYQFRVLDVPELNAMALPGGFVYATRGLMEQMPDEELAFVLAHEIQHVELKHSVRQMEAELYKQIGIMAAVQILTGGQLSEGTANTIALANMVLSNQYSQGMESEADREGIRMMAGAGIDPRGAVAALRTMQRTSQGEMPGFLNAALGTHPLGSDRIAAAEALVDSLDFQGTTATHLEAAIAPAVPVASLPPTDSVWEAQLMLALEGERFGYQPDPSLMRQALYMQASSPAKSALHPDYAVIVSSWTSASTEAQVYSQVLDSEIPRTLGPRTFQNYGVSVVRTPEGRRRVVLLLT